MGERVLIKGNEALAEAAVRAGCRYFFGYPITPQSEILEYMAKRMPEVGGTFLQAESEVAAINMVFGAASTGARAMTSSSGPGISLMQEGLSYLAASEVPCVVINIMRGTPGLGGIGPSQQDYFQATKGGGHGDYKNIVLGPGSVQEAVNCVGLAFELAFRYRNPVVILGDGVLGQMMEPVIFPEMNDSHPLPHWAVGNRAKNGQRVIHSSYLSNEDMEQQVLKLFKKYEVIEKKEVRYEKYFCEDAKLLVAAYGTTARIAKQAVELLREKGIPAGLVRPITLWPFPYCAFNELLNIEAVLSIEMSMGQMFEDVKLAADGRVPVYHYGRTGGMIPSSKEIVEKTLEIWAGREI